MAISFADIPLQHAHLRDKFIEKVNDLLDSGQFILTKTVSDFEEAFAEFVGCNYAVGVNSCADALFFALKLLSIGEGDEVICPGFAPMHVADSVLRAGAKPILVDIDSKTFCINPDKIEEALSPKIKAIIPTHLFGKACDMARIMELANARDLQVIEDVSQAAGAEIEEQFCGALGKFGCFGFDPASNLGAIGDAGMLTTNDEENYRKALMLRDHGRERVGGAYEMIGFNSRLDAIQAVYLDLKIEDLEEANKDRVENARMYEKLFAGSEIVTPEVCDDGSHTYSCYTIKVRDRDRLQNFLKENEIGSEIYYPRGLHREPALEKLGLTRGPLPATDEASRKVLSLPCYPGMKRSDVEKVAGVVLEFLKRNESFDHRRR